MASRPIVVALRVGDPTLAARVAERVNAAPGVALADEEATADALLSDSVGIAAAGSDDAPPALVFAQGAAALAALRGGARAVLPPTSGPAELAVALAAMMRGLVVADAGVLTAALAGGDDAVVPSRVAGASMLTPREAEVLALLAAGASNKVIARRLDVSVPTAKAHVAAVLAKLGAASRADAVARGVRAGLVLL